LALADLKAAVVGHIEWVQFARVEHVPAAGEVAHAHQSFEEPAGGGGVASVQLARLAGASVLMTALGQDEQGRRSCERLAELGVDVRAARVQAPTRRALTLLDDCGERTIITLGARLEPPPELVREQSARSGPFDCVYFTAGDERCLRAARACARVLVASPRAVHALGHGVELDALVLSAEDEHERELAAGAERDARLVVLTEGARGGAYRTRDGASGRFEPAPLPGPELDTYGCGDSFAAGLTFALAAGLELDAALALAARCGAVCATGRGPYERQLERAQL
jgi:ribokinase